MVSNCNFLLTFLEAVAYKQHPTIAVLEKSLFVELRHIHRSCPESDRWPDKGFVAPPGSPEEDKCFMCHQQVDMTDRITMFYYRLPDGRLYGTVFGIWNTN